eukprot:1039137-Prorocentrum_lima.AAC.1
MTSSLVGSEMCIRDRRRSSWHVFMRGHGGGKTLATIAERWRTMSGEEKRCLLYTSDAADDM